MRSVWMILLLGACMACVSCDEDPNKSDFTGGTRWKAHLAAYGTWATTGVRCMVNDVIVASRTGLDVQGELSSSAPRGCEWEGYVEHGDRLLIAVDAGALNLGSEIFIWEEDEHPGGGIVMWNAARDGVDMEYVWHTVP